MAIVRTGRTVAETALADARVKSRKANVAEIAAFVRTAGGTAGVGGVAADALYGQANRNDQSHLRGTLRRQDGIWVTFTKIQSHIEDAVADVATVRCPHMVGVDRYAWKRSPHIAISERITGYKQFGKFILFLVWAIRLTSCFVYRPQPRRVRVAKGLLRRVLGKDGGEETRVRGTMRGLR